MDSLPTVAENLSTTDVFSDTNDYQPQEGYIDQLSKGPPAKGSNAAGKKKGGEGRNFAVTPYEKLKKSKSIRISPSKIKQERIFQKRLSKRAASSSVHGPLFQNGAEDMAIDNHDYCDACRGQGRFLCCESCPRSFHFSCLEPPLNPNNIPEDNWYCRECLAKRAGKTLGRPSKESKGLFAQLVNQINQTNPRAFHLPSRIRNYFKNVITHEDGDYGDATEYKQLNLSSAGIIQDRDLYKQKDLKGRPVVCYACRTAARQETGKRIIQCDFCNLHWHMDCLDPPMDVVPSQTKRWMCPNHSEKARGKLRVLNTQKSITVKETGVRNNGQIDVISEDRGGDDYGVDEVHINGLKFRVPEKIIKLDFIKRITDSRPLRSESRTVMPPPVSSSNLSTSAPASPPSTHLSDFEQPEVAPSATRSEQEEFLTGLLAFEQQVGQFVTQNRPIEERLATLLRAALAGDDETSLHTAASLAPQTPVQNGNIIPLKRGRPPSGRIVSRQNGTKIPKQGSPILSTSSPHDDAKSVALADLLRVSGKTEEELIAFLSK